MGVAFGELGLKTDEFWKLTPIEFHRLVVGYRKRQEVASKMAIFTAWSAANFYRAKELPDLHKVLNPPPAPTAADSEERKKKHDEIKKRMAHKR